MKRKLLLAILALFMLSLMAIGCPHAPRRLRLLDVELPEGPYPAPAKEWSHTFGGRERDEAHSVYQSADGGFIIAGTITSISAGATDFWLVKTDPQGNKEWSQTFGGVDLEEAYCVEETACGGFIIAGWTSSFGAGSRDFWLIKTDPQGNKEWSRTFGGPGWDGAFSVQQTDCGGFIVAGATGSFGKGGRDFWLIKTDPQGNKQWSQTFGGPESDWAHSVRQTGCGGFIIAGRTGSFGAGESDFWLIKTDPQGNKQWSQTFGGLRDDMAHSVQQTADGGFIIAGWTESFGAGKCDFWLIKTDPQGNKEWSQTFGGAHEDRAWSVWQTKDGGFIVVGGTPRAYARGFPMGVPPAAQTSWCIWVVKTDPQGNIEWTHTFGTPGRCDLARSVQQSADGGFIIAGMTDSFGAGGRDFWLIKLAPEH